MLNDAKNLAATAGRLAKRLTLLAGTKDVSLSERLEALEEAVSDARLLGASALEAHLAHPLDEARARNQAAIAARRETLHASASAAGIATKRLTDADLVDIFRLTYVGERVRVDLGSERLAELREVDGNQLFERVRAARGELEREPFAREPFFQLLRRAWRAVQDLPECRDGYVPIRLLHAALAATRALQAPSFVANPDAKHFPAYASAHFMFDLARFGSQGWDCGSELLRAQTPNMATVSAGKTMTPPGLRGLDDRPGPISKLRIERRPVE